MFGLEVCKNHTSFFKSIISGWSDWRG